MRGKTETIWICVLMVQKMVGQSACWTRALNFALKAAPTNYPIHVNGETGTGKELVARRIHENSMVSNGPFIALNCAALSEDLIEAELFGVEGNVPGLGARQPSLGKFELADGGTLFLDEISDLPALAQAKLLRVLEYGTFFRVCGKKEINVRVRVITAGQEPLENGMAQKRFRRDLYYRLSVIEINLPGLRQRRGDVALLAEHFRSKYCHKMQISNSAMRFLRGYCFPGNVRELETMIKRASVLCEDEIIMPAHFGITHQHHADSMPSDAGEAIMYLLEQQSKITTGEVNKTLGIPRTRIRLVMAMLMQQGRIQRSGKGRSTCYIAAESA
jgi:DNA-binding NtrC family response regulator